MYLGVTMALGTASVCLSVLVLNVHHRAPNARVPLWARILFLHHCARFCGFLGQRKRQRRRQCSNNVENHTVTAASDADLPPDMMEIQNILTSGEKQRRTPESFMINETLNYHNIDPQHIKKSRLVNSGGQFISVEEVVKEWQLLARILDRIFFVIVFTVMLTCTLLILLSPFYLRTSSQTNMVEAPGNV